MIAVFSLLCAPLSADEESDISKLKQLYLAVLLRVDIAPLTTVSRREETITAGPGKVQLIDEHDIRLWGYRSLKDMLCDLLSVETTENYFSEIGMQTTVRGLARNKRTVVLVNGMRVNPLGGEFSPAK